MLRGYGIDVCMAEITGALATRRIEALTGAVNLAPFVYRCGLLTLKYD